MCLLLFVGCIVISRNSIAHLPKLMDGCGVLLSDGVGPGIVRLDAVPWLMGRVKREVRLRAERYLLWGLVALALLWLSGLVWGHGRGRDGGPSSRPASSTQVRKPASRPVAATLPAERAGILRRVAAIHGAPGPFAVAGYLMGLYAQRRWKLRYGGWRLQVRHFTPSKVQWSCVADGIQAATGVSAGKLNLQMRFVPKARMRTVFVHKPTGKRLVFRLKAGFIRRYLNTPRSRLRQAGAAILALPFGAIFSATGS